MTSPKTNLIFPCGAKLRVQQGALAHILALQNTGNLPFGICVYHTERLPDRPILKQYGCQAPLPAPCISGCPAKGDNRKFNRLSDIDEWQSVVFCQPLREESA